MNAPDWTKISVRMTHASLDYQGMQGSFATLLRHRESACAKLFFSEAMREIDKLTNSLTALKLTLELEKEKA